jgi:hypothetical protein
MALTKVFRMGNVRLGTPPRKLDPMIVVKQLEHDRAQVELAV